MSMDFLHQLRREAAAYSAKVGAWGPPPCPCDAVDPAVAGLPLCPHRGAPERDADGEVRYVCTRNLSRTVTAADCRQCAGLEGRD